MSAALIPDHFVPTGSTDSDWAFDLLFQDENWVGSRISAVFSRQGIPFHKFEITSDDQIQTPTADLACALRVDYDPDDDTGLFRIAPPGDYTVHVRKIDGEDVDQAAEFTVILGLGLSHQLAGQETPKPVSNRASGSVIVRGSNRVNVVRGGAGPKGDAGSGSGGGSSVVYIHTQTSASALWNVNHNLGERPIVSLRTSGGVEFEGAILHLSANQFQVQLSQPQTGSARCI